MKKLLSLFLILLISFCSVASADSSANYGSKSLDDTEMEVFVLSLFLGDPSVLTMEKSKSNPFDDVNARTVIIGNKALGCELAVLVRISDDQMVF